MADTSTDKPQSGFTLPPPTGAQEKPVDSATPVTGTGINFDLLVSHDLS